MPLCRPSCMDSGSAPNKTTLTVTSKSLRKTDRLLILSCAPAELGGARAHRTDRAIRTRPRVVARAVGIKQPAHYSVGDGERPVSRAPPDSRRSLRGGIT